MTLLSNVKFYVEDFFQILWPSQNIRTLKIVTLLTTISLDAHFMVNSHKNSWMVSVTCASSYERNFPQSVCIGTFWCFDHGGFVDISSISPRIAQRHQKNTKLSTKQSETEYCCRQPDLGKTYDIFNQAYILYIQKYICSTYIIWIIWICITLLIKLRFSEKATKICLSSNLLLTLLSSIQTKMEIFCQILWPSQNIWTLQI